MSATGAIQNAIFSVLSGDSTLTGLATGGVRNDDPINPTYPYIRLGNAVETPWHGIGGLSVNRGFNDVIRIHIFSQYAGDREALQILARVNTLLDLQPLTVSGYGSVVCEYETSRVLNETDAAKLKIRHIPAEYRVRVRA